jgi:hypothetical protein
MTMSGSLFSAEARIGAETIRQLAEARMETLLKAYARAGVPVDDSAVAEVSAEIKDFCTTKQRQAVEGVKASAVQTFGGAPPGGITVAVSAEIEREVGSAIADITRKLRIMRYEAVLDERKTAKAYAAGLGKQWDVFISHASEDKGEFVRPLAEALAKSGLSIWYDETTLRVGDSLRREIDRGLAQSRFGVVVLSHPFFAKKWPQDELDGLFSREVEGVKVILPVWHKITKEEVGHHSLIMAGRLAVNSNAGLDVVVRQLREAMGLA